MIDAILNIIPVVMGWGVIDESLNGLLTAMEKMSPDLHLPSLMGYAKIIGLCIALGVGANECYQMMLGRRGMDVMKLIHIVIISLCISSAGTIAAIAREPGKLLEGLAKSAMEGQNDCVVKKEEEVAMAQEQYIDKVRESMRQIEEAQKAANAQSSNGVIDDIKNWLEEGIVYISNKAKEYTLVAETKMCEWISLILRLIGEVLLQAMIYGLLVGQRIFMHLLEMVAPLMFAISLSPHYKSAWSQWLSKYLSLSLWGFVTYVCMYYVFYVIEYNLSQDLISYEKLSKNIAGDDAQIASIGMQAVGSTCMYLIGLLVGVKILSMVPEAASWLIPGGVSSSAGSAAVGTITAGAMAAASMPGKVVETVGGGSVAGAAGAVANTALDTTQKILTTIGNAGAEMRDLGWTAAQNNAAQSDNRGSRYTSQSDNSGGNYKKLY